MDYILKMQLNRGYPTVLNLAPSGMKDGGHSVVEVSGTPPS